MTQTPQATPVQPVNATYNFSQSYNGMMGLNIGMQGNPSGTIFTYGNGWGQRIADPVTGGANTPGTENLNGYFNYNNQGTWTLGSGSLPAAPFGYTSTAAVTQMSGSVSGTLGHTLTGSMTFIGSLLNGTSFSYSGPVSIENGGGTVFNYTGTWANFPNGSTPASGTASGTMYQWPGYYFTQTMDPAKQPGTYTLTTSTNPNNFNGTLSLSGTGGSRTGVFGYGSTPGNFGGLFYLYSQGGNFLPSSGSGTLASPLVIEGVVGGSNVGALSGNATLSMYTGTSGPFNFGVTDQGVPVPGQGIPGQISLTNGGSYFVAQGGSVQNYTTTPYIVNVFSSPPSPSGGPQALATQPLTTGSLFSFSESYNGFRVSTSIASNMVSIEGYGYGLRTGTTVAGTSPLPTSYGGYFVAQDLGTRVSSTTLGVNWAGVTGTLTGTLSGVAGQTLSGQMTFSGTSQNGTTFNYSGQASLATDGRLIYNYYGSWINGSQTGTGSGTLLQVAGTQLTETLTGGYQQTSTTGTPNTTTVVNTTPLTGTRTDPGSTTPSTTTTASMGSLRTAPTNTFPTGSGSMVVTVDGVVAGPNYDTRWGVATVGISNTPTGSTTPTIAPPVTGVVTIDPSNTLTGQFVGQIKNPDGTVDTLGRNLVSVTPGLRPDDLLLRPDGHRDD